MDLAQSPPPPPQVNDFKDISNRLAAAKEMDQILQFKRNSKFYHDVHIMQAKALEEGNFRKAAELCKLELDTRMGNIE